MSAITGYRLTVEINRQLKLSKNIARAQSDISSGERLQTASDDPAAWSQIALIKRTQSNQQTWLKNVNTSASVADQVSSVLTGLQTSFSRAAELMINANGSTQSPSDRQAMADELNGIANDIDAAATTVDSRGLPLFPANTPLPIPISRALQITATDTKANVFDNVTTPNGVLSLSQMLRDAATAITGTDDTQRKIDSALANDNVQAAITHITALQGQQGVRAARIDTIKEQLESSTTALEEQRGAIAGTDIAGTVAQLQADLLSLNAAQAVFAKINQTTLFDLIR